MKQSAWDWMASLLVPGWTQIMYLRPYSALFFFVCAILAWIYGGYQSGPIIHILASIHGATLISDHFKAQNKQDHASS